MVQRIPIKQPAKTTFTDNDVRNLSEAVYIKRLGPKSARRMLDEDADGGKRLRERAGSYDSLTRAYIDIVAKWLAERDR